MKKKMEKSTSSFKFKILFRSGMSEQITGKCAFIWGLDLYLSLKTVLLVEHTYAFCLTQNFKLKYIYKTNRLT